MNLFILKYNILFISLCFVYSCYSYSPVRFSKSFILSERHLNHKNEDVIEGEDLFADGELKLTDKVWKYESRDVGIYKIHLKRYFVELISFSPIAKINNRGVSYALKGQFRKAEILFNESLKEDCNFAPAYNNLGIIYELFGLYNDAFQMHSKACIIDPENKYFRINFLFLEDKVNESFE